MDGLLPAETDAIEALWFLVDQGTGGAADIGASPWGVRLFLQLALRRAGFPGLLVGSLGPRTLAPYLSQDGRLSPEHYAFFYW